MKKLLLILLCLPLIGFGQDNSSDSAISFSYYIDGMINFDLRKDYNAAIIDITKAIKKGESSEKVFSTDRAKKAILKDYYKNRGKAYYKTEQWGNAINDFRAYFALHTKYWSLKADDYFYRGSAYFYNDDYKLAISDFNKSLKLKLDPNCISNRGLCHMLNEDYRMAIIDFTTMIEVYGQSDFRELRGKCNLMINKYHSSISDFTDILKIKNDSEILYLRGCAYAMLSSESLACSDFKQACNLGYDEACNLSVKSDGVCFPRKIVRSSYQPKTIKNPNKIVLPIIVERNMNFIIITIANKKYKYLIDTGASDMIINSDIERDLLNSGYLRSSHYKESRIYNIANGQQIKLKIAELPFIKINGHTFRDIEIAIGDENASLLLGMSFLGRFDWKLTKESIEMIPK